jgi:hypothetical protein
LKRRWPILLLGLAIAISSLLVLYLGRGQTPAVDQWAYIYAYMPWTVESLLTPHSGHLIVLPLLVYKAMFELFGIESQLPYQVLNMALAATIAALLFALIRNAVGDLAALAAATLMLFYGAGSDVLIPTFQITNLIAIASGLAMLLVLRRENLRGDVFACLLLAMSLASMSIGAAFAAGAALGLALRPPGGRLRRCWVVLVPVVLYATWAIWARKFGQQTIYVHNLKVLGSAFVDQLGAVLAGITGLFTTPNGPKPDANPVPIRTTWGPALVVALAALLVLRLRRPPRPSPQALVAVAVLVVYFLLVGISLNQFRNTFDTRLVYLGSVLALLAVAELCAPWRPTRTALGAIGVVLVFSLCANIAELTDQAQGWRGQWASIKAKLAAVQIAGDVAVPSVLVEDPPGAMAFDIETAHRIAADFGLPAYSEASLKAASAGTRQAADEELGRVLALELSTGTSPRALPGGPSVRVDPVSAGKVRQREGCVIVEPSAGGAGAALLRLPRGGIAYTSTAPVDVELKRFADTPTISFPPRSGPTVLRIPVDVGHTSWRARVKIDARTLICPAGRPG